MTALQLFTPELLENLGNLAAQSPRRRLNHNLHSSPLEPCQRFFNALAAGSYVRPHRHLRPEQAETLLMIRGRLGLILFDANGRIDATHVLAADSAAFGFQLAAGVWHSVVALDRDCVFFEAKAGPYRALSEEELAPWAPAEGSPEAGAYLQELRGHFPERA